ncbi:hypothetical protein GHT06_020855 [Daphnia sinensis]|uniref:Uncharacterized protein n=1 Tax=Daphnia sinensis TaxID=1820382 RepID=A0AAD5KIZ8_9CRUS|nr:hypothetical protein GHT06_020855 [Daphnia sinensis]
MEGSATLEQEDSRLRQRRRTMTLTNSVMDDLTRQPCRILATLFKIFRFLIIHVNQVNNGGKNPQALAPKITLLWLSYCKHHQQNARPSLHVALRTTDQALDFYSPFRPYFANTPRSLSPSLQQVCFEIASGKSGSATFQRNTQQHQVIASLPNNPNCVTAH